MKHIFAIPFLLAFNLILINTTMATDQNDFFKWKSLPELPPEAQKDVQPGVAGAFSGIHNDALIIAGGANFPGPSPWNGGVKIWHDEIYVMTKTNDGFEWVDEQFTLPEPLGYGVSIVTDEGLICIGGNNDQKVSDKVFMLQWQPDTQSLNIVDYPALPVPLAFMAGAKVGQTIYVAGGEEKPGEGATKHFFSLDISKKGKDGFQWQTREAWPGPPRMVNLAASQSNGESDCFYLFSGRNVQPGRPTEFLTDTYEYNPLHDKWSRKKDIALADSTKYCVMAAPVVTSGANHILIFGGDNGKIFRQLETLDSQIKLATDSIERKKLQQQKIEILETHPGFSQRISAYHTVTDAWTTLGDMPTGSHVTTNAFYWDSKIVIPSGEIKPGTRTPKIIAAETAHKAAFGWVNFTVLGLYLALLVGLGVYFSTRENSTDDYFKAGGRIPWWAAGISIFGTQLSAITFMAIPAKTYATDWQYFMFNMTIVMIAPIIIYVFLPFFRRLNITTAYEYLERRFNLTTRVIGSIMFTALQFGRIGIVLFLPSLALSIVTGIDVTVSIILMGVLSIIYTVLGGIEAVVWTDVVQVLVLLGGAILCLILIPLNLENGVDQFINIASNYDKMHIFDFTFDITKPTFWVVLLGGFSANMISYGSDQAVIQRYLTTSSEKNAANGIWTNAILTIPATIIFFLIGTALFVFFKSKPDLLNPTLTNIDAIFPFYIVNQLPNGVAGVLIAAIFAAAMSSLDSSMNSVASVITTDFYQRFKKDTNDGQALRVAKWSTAIVGISGTLFALMMASWDIKSLWDQLNSFIGLFAGGLGGVFLLGILTKRSNGTGAVAGLIASGVIQFIVKEHTSVYLLLYTFTGIVTCVIVGYVVSLLFPNNIKSLDELTYKTLKKDNK